MNFIKSKNSWKFSLHFHEFYDKTVPNLILWILDFLWKSLRKLAEASHMKRYTQTPLQYKLWSFVYLKFLLANLHVIPSTAPKRALLSLLRCKGILFLLANKSLCKVNIFHDDLHLHLVHLVDWNRDLYYFVAGLVVLQLNHHLPLK